MMLRWPLTAACLFLCAPSALANAAREVVIVTATRSAETADDTLASLTVITREDIERLQAQSVQELLRALPGVSVVNNGGVGKDTSVFLRGTEPDHVLVLIDGVKVGSATTGTAAFQDIPVEQIERIEVVRGPRSGLYGSEAMGGVIQIFTRRGDGEQHYFAAIGAGSYTTSQASAGISGGGNRGWYTLSASGFDTDGFNACDGTAGGSSGCFTTEPDDDGYRSASGALRVGRRFDNGLEVDARILRAQGDNAFDGSFVNESETLHQVVGGTAQFALASFWQITLAGGRSRDETENFKDGVFQTRFDTERDVVSFQNDFILPRQASLTLGADYEDDQVDSTTSYAVASRSNDGVFGQYQREWVSHSVQVSLRRDDNEQFGARTTGGGSWGYAFSDTLRLMATIATAFKAPTFNELYYPDYGNPALQPERARSVELGLRRDGNIVSWTVYGFASRVDELIAYDASIAAPANIDRARIRGLEATYSVHAAGWRLNANLTYLRAENESANGNDGKALPWRPEQLLRIDADREFGPYGFGLSWFAEGARYNDVANTRELGGYSTVDVRGEYRFAEHRRIQTRIQNIFDKDFETNAFFNQPGRGLYAALRYQR